MYFYMLTTCAPYTKSAIWGAKVYKLFEIT